MFNIASVVLSPIFCIINHAFYISFGILITLFSLRYIAMWLQYSCLSILQLVSKPNGTVIVKLLSIVLTFRSMQRAGRPLSLRRQNEMLMKSH